MTDSVNGRGADTRSSAVPRGNSATRNDSATRSNAATRSDVVQAAGGIVWRVSNKGLEVLLVHRPRYDDWSFPKGKIKVQEDLRTCAVREIYEETRLHIALGQPLGTLRYRLGSGQRKEVTYWTARVIEAGSFAVKARPQYKKAPKSEIDSVKWFPIEKALSRLTAQGDRDLAKRVRSMAEAGTLVSSTLMLIRHAKAVKRSNWKAGNGSEETRPLTPRGEKQSRVIAAQLANYGISQVHSSPWKRCIDTCEPFAQAAGIRIVKHSELTEAAHRLNPDRVKQTIKQLMKNTDGAQAVSLHRPTLDTVLKPVRRRASGDVAAKIPESDPFLKTGEIFIAHLAHLNGKPKVVGIEQFRPPTS